MVSWGFKLGFQTVPSGRLDQLEMILARGIALFLHPIINHVMLSGMIFISRIWYILQRINWKKHLKHDFSNSYIPNMNINPSAIQ